MSLSLEEILKKANEQSTYKPKQINSVDDLFNRNKPKYEDKKWNEEFELKPFVRDFSAGTYQLASGIAKAPALLYGPMSAVSMGGSIYDNKYVTIDPDEEKVSINYKKALSDIATNFKSIANSFSVSQKEGESAVLSINASNLINMFTNDIPKEVYDNKLTQWLDKGQQEESYVWDRWHSKGVTLETLAKDGRWDQMPAYIAHNVVANMPQMAAVIAATVTGHPEIGGMLLATSAGGDGFAQAKANGQDDSEAVLTGMGHAVAEYVGERLGTISRLKGANAALTKATNSEVAKLSIKQAVFTVTKELGKSFLQEGTEEFATSVMQSKISNLVGGEDKTGMEIFTQAIEEGVMGAFSGAAMTGSMISTSSLNMARKKQRIKNIATENGANYLGTDGNGNALVSRDGEVSKINIKYATNRDILRVVDKDFRESDEGISNYITSTDHNNNAAQLFAVKAWEAVKNRAKQIGITKFEYDNLVDRAADILEDPDVLNKPAHEIAYESYKNSDEFNEEKAPEMYMFLQRKFRGKTVMQALSPTEQARYKQIEKFGLEDYAIVKKIINANKRFGKVYQEAGMINGLTRHFIPRTYKFADSFKEDTYHKTKKDRSRHRLGRTHRTLAAALISGLVPLRDGAIANSHNYMLRMNDAMATKQIKKTLRKSGVLLTAQEIFNKEKAKNPQVNMKDIFKNYDKIGRDMTFQERQMPEESYDEFENEEPVFEQLYAKKRIARDLNILFDDTWLRYRENEVLPENPKMSDRAKMVLKKTLHHTRKINAISKKMRLITGLFHHTAFIRAHLFSSPFKETRKQIYKDLAKLDFRSAYGRFQNDINPLTAWKAGKRLWLENGEIVAALIKNRLTLGLQQEWDEQLVQQGIGIKDTMDKMGLPTGFIDVIQNAEKWWIDGLFQSLGAGLKLKHAVMNVEEIQRKYPNKSLDEVALVAAKLANENFGGLHLTDMRRNKTAQYIWQFFAFAPDWTESNFRLYSQAWANNPDQFSRDLHKEMTGRIITRFVISNVLFGLASAAMMYDSDKDDNVAEQMVENFTKNYTQAWKDGSLHWMHTNITPFLNKFQKLLGQEEHTRRYYFSPAGFFLDPVKWFARDFKLDKGSDGKASDVITELVSPQRLMSSLGRSAYYKASFLPKSVATFIKGTDHTYFKRFSNATDINKAFKENHKLEMTRMPKWGSNENGPVTMEEIPGFLGYTAENFLPLQVTKGLHYFMGEAEGAETVLNMLGLDVSHTWDRKKKKKKKNSNNNKKTEQKKPGV